MWNSTEFGAGGGFGNSGFGNKLGGGFMNADAGSPSVATQDKRKSDRLNNVVPCTVARIMQNADSGEEILKVGSMPAQMITIVGMVRSIDEQSTRVTYYIDDMTAAPMEVQSWLGENEEYAAERRSSIIENTYVRVTGVLRSVKGKRLINAFKIVPVTDMNELTMHFLEVMHTSMAVAVMDNKSADTSMNSTNTIKSEFGNSTSSSFGFGGGNQTSGSFGLNKTQQIVFQAISSSASEKGVNYDYLYSSIKSLSRQTIRETVDFLSNEGHIYSTVDDEHFKSTDSG